MSGLTQRRKDAKNLVSFRRLPYLKATCVKVGMLLNFGEEKCEYKRLVL